MNRTITAGCVAAALATTCLGDQRGVPHARRYFWVWWRNLEGDWRSFIDFTADRKMDGVVIWGLEGWKENNQRCRDVVAYAHDRGVQVVHGLGLNGYEVGKYIVSELPEVAAVIPPSLADTKKGKWSREAIFCPSKPASLNLLRDCLLRATETGIDGFNFETADVDYVTCHCQECETRFASADETESRNKPIEWPLEHLRYAAEVLQGTDGDLWLTCEFAMQRFGKPPYTACDRVLDLNRRIDPRITVVWSEATAPPAKIAERLRAERKNIGFYIRSGGIHGWEAKDILAPENLLPIARRLLALEPVCVMYRGYRPLERWAVNMAAAARILREPQMSVTDLDRTIAELTRLTEPGQAFSFVRRIAPGNLLAPNGPAKLSVSSGDAIHLVDGVADPTDGLWRTERNSPKQAWAVAEWPDPVTVARVRLFHQIDGQYRSLDYTVQYDADGEWRDLPGMPIRDNDVYGWSEHVFEPVTSTRLRLLITKSKHGNRMSMGEWEAYGP